MSIIFLSRLTARKKVDFLVRPDQKRGTMGHPLRGELLQTPVVQLWQHLCRSTVLLGSAEGR